MTQPGQANSRGRTFPPNGLGRTRLGGGNGSQPKAVEYCRGRSREARQCHCGARDSGDSI
jgi:hypothetical protein